MDPVEVQKESNDIDPNLMVLDGVKDRCEVQTEKYTSRHNKPKKANSTNVTSQGSYLLILLILPCSFC